MDYKAHRDGTVPSRDHFYYTKKIIIDLKKILDFEVWFETSYKSI